MKFKPPNLKVYKSVSNVYQTVLNRKLTEDKHDLRITEKKYLLQKKLILRKLSFIEKGCLIRLLTDSYKKRSQDIANVQQKILLNLGKKQRNRSHEKCIVSLIETKKLSIREENAVRFGLKYHIFPTQICSDEIKANVEQLLNSAKIRNDNNSQIDDKTRDEIKFTGKRFLNDAKRFCSSFSNQALHRTLKSFSQDKNIRICKFDKWKGTTIMNSNEYYEKLESNLSDKSKFEEVNVNKKTHPIPYVKNKNNTINTSRL